MATIDAQAGRPEGHQLAGSASFVPIPDAFGDAPADVRNAVKLEFWTVYSEAARVQTLFSTDVALIDLRAVKASALDPERIARDCEHLARVMRESPDAPARLVAALQRGDSEGVEEAQRVAEAAGLTEAHFVKQGGGLFFLVVIAGAALLGGGCATVNSNKPFKAPTTPQPTPTPPADAGPAEDAGGHIPR